MISPMPSTATTMKETMNAAQQRLRSVMQRYIIYTLWAAQIKRNSREHGPEGLLRRLTQEGRRVESNAEPLDPQTADMRMQFSRVILHRAGVQLSAARSTLRAGGRIASSTHKVIDFAESILSLTTNLLP